MARFAVDFGDVFGMRVFLDIGVAVVALQAAVNAGTEFAAIYGDAVPRCIGHALVGVAGEAIGLRRTLVR